MIRPTLTENAGAVGRINSLTRDLLFEGQSQAFFDKVIALAIAADAAQRGF